MSEFQAVGVDKYTDIGSVAGILRHDGRFRQPSNADPARKKENICFFGGKSIEADMAQFRAILPKKHRSNAVLMTEVIVQAGHDAYDSWDEKKKRRYWDKVMDWLKKRYAPHGNLVQAVLHRDERGDHLHFCFVPITQAISKGKPVFDKAGQPVLTLSHDLILGAPWKLKQLHTDMAQEVGKEFGLVRAIEGSRARHKTIEQFFKKLEQKAPALMREIKETEAYRELHERLRRVVEQHDQVHAQEIAELRTAGEAREAQIRASLAAAAKERDLAWKAELKRWEAKYSRLEGIVLRGDPELAQEQARLKREAARSERGPGFA